MKSGKPDAHLHPSLFDIHEKLGHAREKKRECHRGDDKLVTREKARFFHVIKTCCAVIPSEEIRREN